MARIVTETIVDTVGKEAGLAVMARIFLVVGILAVFVCIALVIITAEFFWIACGALSLVLSVVFYMIFSALSEIIVLLKRLCGIDCKTAVSGTKKGKIYVCSECGALTWAQSPKCEKCGVEFETGDSTGTA